MKKIIALAVAGAFIAPVYAADITVTGEVVTQMKSADGNNYLTNSTQDIKITASETFDNGLSVTAYVLNDASNGSNTQDSAVTVSGGFGSIAVGKDAGVGGGAFDDVSDVASAGVGANAEIDDGVTTAASVEFKPNLGIAGLEVALGFAAEDADGTAAESSGFAVKYAVGGFSVAYGTQSADSASLKSASILSATYSNGPIYVGVDSSKNIAGVDGDDTLNIGATYSMGDVTFEFERAAIEDASNIDVTDTVVGINYKVGPGLEVYVAQESDETASSATAKTSVDNTYVGLEYKF